MYRIEMAGEVFYNILADRVGNETAADLLRKNAVEERGHARRLARMISIKIGHEWEPSAEENELLAVPLPETIDSKMFAAVVQGEINGDAGYQRWADAETDEEVVRLLRLNGREETIHAGRAQQVFDLLNA
jgi:rubrerythrin